MEAQTVIHDSASEVTLLLSGGKKRVKHYNVEIILFLMCIGYQLFDTVSVNALEVYFCRYVWNITENRCLNTSSFYIEKAQKFAANFKLIDSSLTYVVPAILLFFMGPWSDIHGRKLLLMMPVTGLLIATGLWTWASMISRVNPVFWIVFRFPYFLSGGNLVCSFAAHCCICDVTEGRNRSFRLGMLQTFICAGYLVGGALSLLLIPEGYTAVFFVSTVFYMCSLFYICCFFEETMPLYHPSTESNKKFKKIEYLREMVLWYGKQTSKNRKTITLAIVGRLLFYSILIGTSLVEYLYLQLKLDIKLDEYAAYLMFTKVLYAGGTAGGTYVLSNKMKMNDAYILIITVGLHLISLCCFIFSNTIWLIYIGTVTSLLSRLYVVIHKSFLSKIVDSGDVGKVLAIDGFGESLIGLTASFVYPIIYKLTLTNFPEAVYILSTILCIIILFIFIIIIRMDNIPLQMEWRKKETI